MAYGRYRHVSISNGAEIMILGGWFAEDAAETEIWNISSNNGTELVEPKLNNSDYYNIALFLVDRNFCRSSK